MGIETAADRQAFVETFGVSATVGGVSLYGIFDDPHYETLEISTSTPMLTIVTSDAPSVAHQDAVIISEVSFSGIVKDVQSDGTGLTVLMLSQDYLS